ncbi:MAG: hypothetical protein RLN87_00700 [Parasphingopyxis sp.]|uniref:hypothetical protein n=1 Tax=Parasphingopyxis sp. TaxID=1920299 RepID=UPI0026279BF0|nr:hypothetical protein [uncultured Parasphingopyxis sp.]
MDELQSRAEDLKRLAGRKPTDKRYDIIQGALQSKWEGDQSLAIQVLGQWGGRRSIDILRRFLETSYEKPMSWAVRKVSVRALANTIEQEDAEWIERLHASRSNNIEKFELRPLLERLKAIQ